jgi:hypothetical protein
MPRKRGRRQQRRATLRLVDLFPKLGVRGFIERHWSVGAPVVSACAGHVSEAIASFSGLRSAAALLERRKADVYLFGPDRFRAIVPPAAALRFLERGYNVYIPRVQEEVPEALALFAGIANDLGVLPWQLGLEAFAGAEGGVSSRHFDNDFNIQILIEGEKAWRMEENAAIRNPLRSCHPENGESLFEEEAYATRPEIGLEFDPTHAVEFGARAGSATFVPRGMWHQAESLSTTWSVSLQIKGMTWAQALADALADRLHRVPEFRAYVEGVPYRGQGNAANGRQDRTFGKAKTAALDAIRQISLNEAALSGTTTAYRWSNRAPERSLRKIGGALCLVAPGLLDEALEFDADVIPALRALLRLQRPFLWRHALAVAGGANVVLLRNLIETLVEVGVLERGAFDDSGLHVFRPEGRTAR